MRLSRMHHANFALCGTSIASKKVFRTRFLKLDFARTVIEGKVRLNENVLTGWNFYYIHSLVEISYRISSISFTRAEQQRWGFES